MTQKEQDKDTVDFSTRLQDSAGTLAYLRFLFYSPSHPQRLCFFPVALLFLQPFASWDLSCVP